MAIFSDEGNKLIRYYMKMWGHLDYRFILISEKIPPYTPKQISNHWKTYLDPQLYEHKNKSISFWKPKRKFSGKANVEVKKQKVRTEEPEQKKFFYIYDRFLSLPISYISRNRSTNYSNNSMNLDLSINSSLNFSLNATSNTSR
ncbi:hypothetical protein C1645_880968 [Glomus cerebriforme]|uniref:HTH myb-type domain-containing protein n=1 Tax=Glomus cerebriforme TaxID=658196 RepID=A0A397S8E5_9GLOM|nr:hypothetical protein C1645_880968 [Glomus cerebriforme]